ncbi:hypothetical protein IG631_12112 [Alternaria alternata]|nr:hypothetical protein IG631_12112 [Alternaria alternata]
MTECLDFASQGSTFTEHVQNLRCGVTADRQGRGTCLSRLIDARFLKTGAFYRKIILHSLSRFTTASASASYDTQTCKDSQGKLFGRTGYTGV